MGKPMLLLAGPCVIESEDSVLYLADEISKITQRLNVDYYFKASFDKANRTSVDSYRGPGLERGLKILEKAKSKCGVRIVTDIHESHQAEAAAEIADIVQIPAFLCRQTDLLVAAAKTGKKINIKKAQFLSPEDMSNVVKKVEQAGNSDIMLCERGTSFGYNNLVVDMTAIPRMKQNGYPVIFDATHSLQKPGGKGASSGGAPKFAGTLANAALAVGADGLFIEVHSDPVNALSDAGCMVRLDALKPLLENALRIYEVSI